MVPAVVLPEFYGAADSLVLWGLRCILGSTQKIRVTVRRSVASSGFAEITQGD